MADDPNNRGNPDRQRINTNQPHELQDWSVKFEVTPDELKAAVTKVGNQASDVEQHLRGRKVTRLVLSRSRRGL